MRDTGKKRSFLLGAFVFVFSALMLSTAVVMFSPSETAYAAKASKLKIKMTSWPESIVAGSDFTLKGKISSNYRLSNVRVYVFGENLDVTVNPKGKSTSVKNTSTINKKLDFGKLVPDEYTLIIVASDVSGKTVHWEKDFAVKPAKTKASGEQEQIYTKIAENRKNFSKSYRNKTEKELLEDMGRNLQSNYGYTYYAFFPNAAGIVLPEEILAYYPELESVEINYEWSSVYSNAVCVCYELMWDDKSEVRYGIRTGDWSKIENCSDGEKAVFERVKEVSEKLGLSEMDTVKKLKAICDYIADILEYDENKVGRNPYTAWGALQDGHAVCSGYTDLFTWFAIYNGIETIKVYGQNHVWNQVKVDGKWYNICTTNYDSADRLDYFMVTNDYIDIDEGFHIFRAQTEYNECNDASYAAYAYMAYFCSSLEEIRAMFESQKGNETYIAVVRSSDFDYSQVRGEFYSVTLCNRNYVGKYVSEPYIAYSFTPIYD